MPIEFTTTVWTAIGAGFSALGFLVAILRSPSGDGERPEDRASRRERGKPERDYPLHPAIQNRLDRARVADEQGVDICDPRHPLYLPKRTREEVVPGSVKVTVYDEEQRDARRKDTDLMDPAHPIYQHRVLQDVKRGEPPCPRRVYGESLALKRGEVLRCSYCRGITDELTAGKCRSCFTYLQGQVQHRPTEEERAVTKSFDRDRERQLSSWAESARIYGDNPIAPLYESRGVAPPEVTLTGDALREQRIKAIIRDDVATGMGPKYTRYLAEQIYRERHPDRRVVGRHS